jgi:uncharacterized protein (DUF427 family)
MTNRCDSHRANVARNAAYRAGVVGRMATATWNGTVIAQSDDTVVVEGNPYFPLESVTAGVLQPSEHTTVCGWKGTANYYDLVVDGARNANAVWYYTHPKPAAAEIEGRVAFWKGVVVTK